MTAQDTPLAVEGRGGVALPVASFRTGPDQGGKIAPAPAFGVHFVYRGPSGWGPYVGFSQNRFGCRADGCPRDHYVATDWDLGVQRTIGGAGWVRVGAVFGRVERYFETAETPLHRTSSLGVGVEAGVGLRVTLPGRIGLTPGVRYSSFNTRFPDDTPLRLRWVSADFGIAFGF